MYDSKLLEANYLLGVSHLSLQDYEQAIKEFTYVIDKNPFFKKIFIFYLLLGTKNSTLMYKQSKFSINV